MLLPWLSQVAAWGWREGVGGCAAVSRRPASETCPASGESVSGLVQSQCSATRSFLISIPDVASQSTFHHIHKTSIHYEVFGGGGGGGGVSKH